MRKMLTQEKRAMNTNFFLFFSKSQFAIEKDFRFSLKHFSSHFIHVEKTKIDQRLIRVCYVLTQECTFDHYSTCNAYSRISQKHTSIWFKHGSRMLVQPLCPF